MKVRIQCEKEYPVEEKREEFLGSGFARRSDLAGKGEAMPIQREYEGEVRSSFSPVQLLCHAGNEAIVQRTMAIGNTRQNELSGTLLGYIQKKCAKAGLMGSFEAIVARIEMYLYEEKSYQFQDLEELWFSVIKEIKREGKLVDAASQDVPHPITSAASGSPEMAVKNRKRTKVAQGHEPTPSRVSQPWQPMESEPQSEKEVKESDRTREGKEEPAIWNREEEIQDREIIARAHHEEHCYMQEQMEEKRRRMQEIQARLQEREIPEEMEGLKRAESLPQNPRREGMQIQRKLTIGAVGDKYEQEADRVASEVVKQINRAPLAPDREVDSQNAEQAQPIDGLLQRKPILRCQGENLGGVASRELEGEINRARGGGQPLHPELQRSMGQAMGVDFSGVRVHADGNADRLNQSLQAKAFTTGQDVFFRQGAYQPKSERGQELIAHELTHVKQQNRDSLEYSQKQRFHNRLGSCKERIEKDVRKQFIQAPEIQKKVVNKNKKESSLKDFINNLKQKKENKIETYNDFARYIFNLHNRSKKAIPITRLVNIYMDVVQKTEEKFSQNEGRLNDLKKYFITRQNQEAKGKCKSYRKDKKKVVIYRGTGPEQAIKILRQKTLGGESSGGMKMDKPSEEVAKNQTGYNIKETKNGKIEEWSEVTGGLTGFSTGGVMLVGVVDRSLVAVAKERRGERGVTGYANLEMYEVAIYKIGEKSVAPIKTLKFQEAKKIFQKDYMGNKGKFAMKK